MLALLSRNSRWLFILAMLVSPAAVAHAGIVVISTNSQAKVDFVGGGSLTIQKGDLAQFTVDSNGLATSGFVRNVIFNNTGNIDAVFIRANGNIILSTKAMETLGGVTFRPGDLVEYNPNGSAVGGVAAGQARLYLKGNEATAGTDFFGNTHTIFHAGNGDFANEDIDGVHLIGGSDSQILLTTAGGTFLGSPLVHLDPEDIGQYNPFTNSASVFFNTTALFDKNVDGVSLTAAGNLVLSANQMVTVGSTTYNKDDVFEYNQNAGTVDGLAAGDSRIYFSHSNFEDNEDIEAIHIVGSESAAVPEPMTLAMWSIGLAAMGCVRLRRSLK